MRLRKNLAHFIDPILVTGLLISVTISVFMVLMGNDNVTSLMVGFLTTIITLLIDILSKIQRTENTLLEASDLSKLFSHLKIAKDIREIANNYDLVEKYDFDHYLKIANAQIIECKMRLRELALGNAFVKAKSLDEYSAYMAFSGAKTSVNAIDFGNSYFWLSKAGQKYLRINQEAVERGIKVTRIFAIDDQSDENLKTVINSQKQAGIKTLVITPERVKQEFMIIDNRIRIDIVFDSNGDYTGQRIILDPPQVEEGVERFGSLESFSKIFDEK